MTSDASIGPPGPRDTWRWWLRVLIVGTGLVVAGAAGLLALGRRPSDAVGLAVVVVTFPLATSVVSERKRRRAREHGVLGDLDAARRRSALAAYAGKERPDDPAVARDAIRLLLAVAGDAMGVATVTALLAALLGAGFVVVAVTSSRWWWFDAAAAFSFAALLHLRGQRLGRRLRALKAVAAQQPDPG